MEDFFRKLKREPGFDNHPDIETKINESNLLKVVNNVEDSELVNNTDDNCIMPQKDENPVNVEQKDEKKVEKVDTDDTQLQKMLNEISQETKDTEELRNKSQPETDETNNTVIVDSLNQSDVFEKLKEHPELIQSVDVKEINDKLNEINEQSQAALEDLKSQSSKIIDTARAQTNKVIENARNNFSVFTKALEDEDERKPELPTAEESTFEEFMEKYSPADNLMDF